MLPETSDLIEAGLRAWMASDLDALENVLDPRVNSVCGRTGTVGLR